MSLTERIGLGVTLGYSSNLTTPSYTVLGAVLSVDGPDAETTEVETSLLSAKYNTYSGAAIDPGSYKIVIAYDPADTVTNTVLGGLLTSSAMGAWQISYPIIGAESQQTDVFQGFVKGFKRSTLGRKDMITAEVTIRVSGKAGIAGS